METAEFLPFVVLFLKLQN